MYPMVQPPESNLTRISNNIAKPVTLICAVVLTISLTVHYGVATFGDFQYIVYRSISSFGQVNQVVCPVYNQ